MTREQTKKRILVIDDESTVLRALSLLLEAVGHNSLSAKGSRDALEIITSGEAIDFILCDLRMPEMSGIDLLCDLNRMGCTIPFILMSGHATPNEVNEAIREGAVGFLGKPFSPEMLDEILKLGKGSIPSRCLKVA